LVTKASYGPRGATAGKFKVKSCGKVHAWCSICRPDHPQVLRTIEKQSSLVYKEIKACKNCGSCDSCLGLLAKEGFKFCRECNIEIPIDQFAKREHGKIRNICKICWNLKHNSGKYSTGKCIICHKFFTYYNSHIFDKCGKCRVIKECNCLTCGIVFLPENGKLYCSEKCKIEAKNKSSRENDRINKELVMMHYSNGLIRCNCCHENYYEGLALDHIHAGGKKHREQVGNYWSWFIKNDYPEGFQVLCHNCNGMKGTQKECPTKDARCAKLRKFFDESN
jgi:hypothetical protein